MKLSVIVPCYNEEKNIPILKDKLFETLKGIRFEIIFVNDGSDDDSFEVLKQLHYENKTKVKVINFSKNFGKDAAIYAGLIHSIGEYTTIIDADLEQNPIYILKMLSFLENNTSFDQVAMVNTNRIHESKITKFFKKSFYKIINYLSETKFVDGASDFRMFNKECLNSIIKLKEKNRFSKGIFSWVGFNTHYIDYNSTVRTNGESKFGFRNSIKYAKDGIFDFSDKPLKIVSIFGYFVSLSSFVYMLTVIIEVFIKGKTAPGYASLMSIVLFLGGIQLISVGILGEYISKIYTETKDRPIFIAKDKLGFSKEKNLL